MNSASGPSGPNGPSSPNRPQSRPGSAPISPPLRSAARPAVESGPQFAPLYSQIKERLMRELAAGEWRPGEAIPSEMELAERFNVSQGTVRKAVEELAQANHLVRRQGKGTYVTTHTEERTQFRFLRLAPNDTRPEVYPENRLIDVRRRRAPAAVAKLLELRSGESIVVIRRVLSFRGQPTILDEISLPATVFRSLDAAKFNEYRGSMYNLFETEFGTRMVHADERLRAIGADAYAAAVLGVLAGTPLLCVDRVAFTYNNKPVEFRRGLYRTDSHHYQNQLS